ncbi:MAG: helix-turn-helix domain-containing protein [Spirochaetales bacterium]|nr:helix-turn-helix domain-containing protein [Spirochaetales bacterium]
MGDVCMQNWWKNYLTLVRIHQARKLLVETDMKIYEICEAVGYVDVNNLNRVFEKEYGMKSNEYRKQKSILL